MRLMLMLLLITASSCAGRARMPDAPAMVQCENQKAHFQCRKPGGKHYSDPYPGKEPLVCMPTGDWAARKNWESTLR